MAKGFGGTNSFLAERLRQARLQAGYSQQNIADALNVNRATYTYYETGKTSPDPVTLGKIARICGAPIEFFFEEEDTPTGPCSLRTESAAPRSPFPTPTRLGSSPQTKKSSLPCYARRRQFPPVKPRIG